MKPAEFRKIRERLDLTQAELAKILGLSGYTPISHYESGFRTPGVIICALMRVFDELPDRESRKLRELLRMESERILARKNRNS